jgi:hypothetical protein
MYPKDWLSNIRYCALGAIEGWLFGTFAWLLNELHLRDVPQPVSDYVNTSSDMIICLADPFPPSYGGVIILCMLTFAIVSYGAHRLVRKAWLPILLLWQIIGLCSLTLLLVVAQITWNGYFFSLRSGWVLLLGFGSAIVSSFIIGIIVESGRYAYPQSKQESGGEGAA